jgi:hypothetical protein
VAALVALALALVAGALVVRVGWILALFLSAPAGGVIAEAVLRSTRGKRGRVVQIIVVASIVAGAFLGPWVGLVVLRGTLAVLPANPLAYLAPLLNPSSIILAVIASGAAGARLR